MIRQVVHLWLQRSVSKQLLSFLLYVFHSFLVGDLVNLRQKLFLISNTEALGWLYSIEIVIISASELLYDISHCNQF